MPGKDPASSVPGPDEARATGNVRLTHAERRAQLLDVTAELIIERSIDAVTMEGVAARAGVSKALPYRFFANRDDLLVALYDRESGALLRRVYDATFGIDRFEPRIRATVESWLTGVSESGLLLGMLLLSTSLAGPIEERRQRLVAELGEAWGQALAAEFGLDPRRARRMITFVLVGSQALIPFWLRHEDERATLVDDFVTVVVGGIRALAAAPEGSGG